MTRAGAALPVLVASLWLVAPSATASAAGTCPAVGNIVTVDAATMRLVGGLQGLINKCPTGTTFNLPGGQFSTFGTFYPLDGDVINGAGTGTGGTVLLGSKTIPSSTWTVDKSGDWVDADDVVFDTTAIAKADDTERKNCADGYYPQPSPNPGVCDYPDQLFMDGGWLVRVLKSDPSKPCDAPIDVGQYCINYASHRIYLGSNPSGHTMTFTGTDDGTGKLLQSAMQNISPSDPSIVNVTVKNLVVSQYSNSDAAGGAIGMGDGWTVTNVVSSYNHGCGLSIGGTQVSMPKLVTNATLMWNGQSGFCGVNAGTTFDRSTVTYNNQDFWSVPYGGGGGKFSAGGPITVTNSTFSNNNGNGLGFDVGEQNMTITGNTFADNVNFGGGGHGLHIEVSCYGTVTGNVTYGNERVGIYVLNSHDVTVGGTTPSAANTVGPDGTSVIKVQTTNRSGTNACGKQSQATNDVVKGNHVTMTTDDTSGIVNKTSCKTCVTGSSFSSNTYTTSGNCADDLWQWYDGSKQQKIPWSTWHTTYAQDGTGTCA
jgi:parallel beta-helix repeat protein